ncbi:MAG: hypothetical protein EZS28_004420, partial [Streblomastix strix]
IWGSDGKEVSRDPKSGEIIGMPLFWFQTLKQTHKVESEYVFVEGARRLIPPHMYVSLFVINVLNILIESKALQRKIGFKMNCDQEVLSVKSTQFKTTTYGSNFQLY